MVRAEKLLTAHEASPRGGMVNPKGAQKTAHRRPTPPRFAPKRLVFVRSRLLKYRNRSHSHCHDSLRVIVGCDELGIRCAMSGPKYLQCRSSSEQIRGHFKAKILNQSNDAADIMSFGATAFYFCTNTMRSHRSKAKLCSLCSSFSALRANPDHSAHPSLSLAPCLKQRQLLGSK